jgi:hypothetical protein
VIERGRYEPQNEESVEREKRKNSYAFHRPPSLRLIIRFPLERRASVLNMIAVRPTQLQADARLRWLVRPTTNLVIGFVATKVCTSGVRVAICVAISVAFE